MKVEVKVDLPWVATRSTTKRQMVKRPMKFASFAMSNFFFSHTLTLLLSFNFMDGVGVSGGGSQYL